MFLGSQSLQITGLQSSSVFFQRAKPYSLLVVGTVAGLLVKKLIQGSFSNKDYSTPAQWKEGRLHLGVFRK